MLGPISQQTLSGRSGQAVLGAVLGAVLAVLRATKVLVFAFDTSQTSC